jgi:hypothetical protein
MITARTRLEAFSFWRMIVFLLNGIIFILIGLQLPAVVSGLATESWTRVREALQVERQTIVHLRNQHQINDETLRLLQRDIDLAEARLVEAHY